MIFDTYVGQADPHHYQTWLISKPTKMDWFCHQTLPTLFLLHLLCFPPKRAQKPRDRKFMTFGTNVVQADPLDHQTWVNSKPTKMN